MIRPAGPLDLALAGQPAVPPNVRRLLDAVVLGLGRLGEQLHALLDVDVAGGAGADPAAGVLDVDVAAEGELEDVVADLGAHDVLFLIGPGDGLGVLADVGDGVRGRTRVDLHSVRVHGKRVPVREWAMVEGGWPGQSLRPSTALRPSKTTIRHEPQGGVDADKHLPSESSRSNARNAASRFFWRFLAIVQCAALRSSPVAHKPAMTNAISLYATTQAAAFKAYVELRKAVIDGPLAPKDLIASKDEEMKAGLSRPKRPTALGPAVRSRPKSHRAAFGLAALIVSPSGTSRRQDSSLR